MSIEEKAVQIVVTAEVITVASIDENGYPRPVAMVKLKDENGGSYKTPLWSDWMLSHFPGEVEDSEYCVLKFTPESSTYSIDNEFAKDDKFLYLL